MNYVEGPYTARTLGVGCPKCGAGPGEPCHAPNGRIMPVHAARWRHVFPPPKTRGDKIIWHLSAPRCWDHRTRCGRNQFSVHVIGFKDWITGGPVVGRMCRSCVRTVGERTLDLALFHWGATDDLWSLPETDK